MRIFISYRYDDDQGGVRRLYKTLSKTTVDGERCQVAMGRSEGLGGKGLAGGGTWDEGTDVTIGDADVVLLFIGAGWRRDLDKPRDSVRLELDQARAADTPVAVVLFGGADPKSAQGWPSELTKVVRGSPVLVSIEQFEADVAQLLAHLGSIGRRGGRPAGAETAMLRLVPTRTGLMGGGVSLEVRADGRRIGVLITGRPGDFPLLPGDYSLRIGKGPRFGPLVAKRWSNEIRVQLEPGKPTDVGYETGSGFLSPRLGR